MSADMLKLQVNDSGAWRNVAQFPAGMRGAVMHAAGLMARLFGSRPTWRIANSLHAAIVSDDAIRATLAQRIEVIVWHDVREEMPDDDITVLIQSAHGNEPVWLGWHDEDGWHSLDAEPIKRVSFWADVPEGALR